MFKKKKPDINLLPEGQAFTPVSKSPFIFATLVLGALLVAFVGLTIFDKVQKREINSLNSQLNQLEAQGKQEVLETAKLLTRAKKVLADYQTFEAAYVDVNLGLSYLESVIPTQIQLTSLTIQSDGKIALSGTGPNPETIDAFIKEISKQKDKFSSATIVSVAKNQNSYVFGINLELTR